MAEVKAIISDFGGVLTSPLAGAFAAFEAHSGIAARRTRPRDGRRSACGGGPIPLFDLETGRLSESEFLGELGAQLSTQLEREVVLDGFGERYFADLEPNQPLIEYMRTLRGRGYRMAICTNNVREWETRWRAMLPVGEIFDVVVDSAFVGVRKPEPRIYELTLERLGVDAGATLFIDDIEINCDAARELGLRTVWFRSTEQTIQEIETALMESD